MSPTRLSPDGIAPPDIPGYILERQIGRGGSATVYLARESKHSRLVAVKVLHPALAASLHAERFLREIKITAQLTHPHILPLLDSGVAGGLLYYVTPYVAGESLRDAMDRERQFELGLAVRIIRDVAEALDYAHRQGVVHRDVKPENILLADGHAVVADFGIARAVRAATDDRLTMGIVGTPRYMSPEQANGVPTIDGRTDIYSLACVLYELLAGVPVFTGEGPDALIAQHLADPVPSMRGVTPRVPPGVEHALNVAMAKAPTDRFATASAFADALTSSGTSSNAHAGRRFIANLVPARLTRLMLATAAIVVAAMAVGRSAVATSGARRLLASVGIGEATLDTTLYVVLPLDSAARAGATIDVANLLRAGLGRWRDIVVEDESRVADAAGHGGSAPTSERARRTATSLGAGRYARVDVTRIRDSLDVSAALFDTRTNARLANREARMSADPALARVGMAALADSLLFRERVPQARAEGNAGTTSLFARQAYLRGHVALADGNFARADTEFFDAARRDPAFAQALVWLANLRSWVQPTTRLWGQLTNQAGAQRARLAPSDTLRLNALTAFASSDTGRACALWRQLTTDSPNDFTSWYALGNCLRRDLSVVRSPADRTRWQFRSSMHEAVTAYERAFRLQPSVVQAFGGPGLGELQVVMITSGARVRSGRAISPDTLQFSGYPVWQGDSLAFIPLLKDQSRLASLSNAVGEAVQHQRLRFRDVAAMWRAEFPNSADAAEAVAVSMEMLGDPAALDTLQRARAASVMASDRLRMAVNEVWLRVKFSLPSNPAGLRAARALADSILWTHPVGAGEESVGSLASLTGRAELAATYARLGAGDDKLPAIARSGPALLAFASLAGPPDSLRELERVVEGAVESLPLSSRASGRRDWLTRAAALAFPGYRFASLPAGGETGLRLGNLIAASVGSDTLRVRQILSDISAARQWLRPADIMPDGLLPEASALVRIGDVPGAIARLDPTLRAIRFTASRDLALSYRAGSLVRAMVLRADLAHQTGDEETARLWARAVVELWSGANSFLQPTVQRMQQLAR